jgi:hypothetical protein
MGAKDGNEAKLVNLTEAECLTLIRLGTPGVEPQHKDLVDGIVKKLQKNKKPSFSREEREWLSAYMSSYFLSRGYNKRLKEIRATLSPDVDELRQRAMAQTKKLQIDAKINILRETAAAIKKRIAKLEQEKLK